jgi:phosphatidylglycerol:prolipoprotein diacylglycerol transferase
LPWGIPIECAHRIADYPCDTFPFATTRFQPLFLYESLSGVLGAAFLIWLGFRFRNRLRPGDLALSFFIWYGVVRFALETLRHDNWTFFGVPMAQIVSLLFILPAVAILLWRHRDRDAFDDPPSRPDAATWGAPGRVPDAEDDDLDEPSPDVAVA